MKVKINSNGDVEYEWVKMGISDKGSGFYINSPGYHLLSKDSSNKIFAFKRPIYLDEPFPHHLEKCNELESTKLENKTTIGAN